MELAVKDQAHTAIVQRTNNDLEICVQKNLLITRALDFKWWRCI